MVFWISQVWGASFHVSFPDLRPFGRPGQTYNSSGITPFGSRWAPSNTRSEKFSFFHNARRNGQIKLVNLSDGPIMPDGMGRSSRLDLSNRQIHPVRSSGFLACMVYHAWCLSIGLDVWCLSVGLDDWCLSNNLALMSEFRLSCLMFECRLSRLMSERRTRHHLHPKFNVN